MGITLNPFAHHRMHSDLIKRKNVDKHLRIARACKDPHERQVHIDKATKLAKRYKFKLII